MKKTIIAVFDDSGTLIGLWSSCQKAIDWLQKQYENGSWTKGEIGSVSIETLPVDQE